MPESSVNFGAGVSNAWSNVAAFVPKFAVFLLILIVGYLIAKAIAKILSKVLTRVGFDRLVERRGVKRVLDRSSYDASGILAKVDRSPVSHADTRTCSRSPSSPTANSSARTRPSSSAASTAVPAPGTTGQTRGGSGSRSPGMARMVAPAADIDTAGYHPVRREFSLTEGSAPGTRGCLGAGCRYQRRFVAGMGG